MILHRMRYIQPTPRRPRGADGRDDAAGGWCRARMREQGRVPTVQERRHGASTRSDARTSAAARPQAEQPPGVGSPTWSGWTHTACVCFFGDGSVWWRVGVVRPSLPDSAAGAAGSPRARRATWRAAPRPLAGGRRGGCARRGWDRDVQGVRVGARQRVDRRRPLLHLLPLDVEVHGAARRRT